MKSIISIFILLCGSVLNSQEIQFSNTTSSIPYIQGTVGQSKCVVDMNGDKLDDVVRVSKSGIEIDFQLVKGGFRHQHFTLDIKVLPSYSLVAGDLNKDGYNDLIFGNEKNISVVLFKPLSNSFDELVIPSDIFSQRSTLFDIDKDGDLDAFICNDEGQSLTFKNDGEGNFSVDATLLPTSPLAGNYSAIWVDYNNDDNTDLYISKCYAEAQSGDLRRTNLLYKNNGDGTFTELAKSAGLADNAQSWSTAFEDFDNDGDFDAMVINHDEANRLFRNNGDGTFTDVIVNSGIAALDLGAFEVMSADFDNDGNLDLLSDLKVPLYLGNGDLTFRKASLEFVPSTYGDFNNDGFLDILSRNQLWTNNTNDNHWLTLSLTGVESNKNGIGAKVEITSNKGKQIREVRAGQSYSPMNTLNVHFGLGQDTLVEEILITWPSGIVTQITDVNVDNQYHIVERSCSDPLKNIVIEGKNNLCPNDTIVLSVTNAFAKYHWSNGDTTSNVKATKPGTYWVICEDEFKCKSISKPFLLNASDLEKPKLDLTVGDYYNCLGETVILKATSTQAIKWSTNVDSIEEINIVQSGSYYVYIDSVCGTGKIMSDTIVIHFQEAAPPKIISMEYIQDSIHILLEGDNCIWYDEMNEGNEVYQSCDLKLKKPERDTILFVENRINKIPNVLTAGLKDTAGFQSVFPFSRQMYFTINEHSKLISVDMYVKNIAQEGIRKIQVKSKDNAIVHEQSFFLNVGKNVVNLNFDLQPGHYAISCDRNDQLMNVGAIDYPFPIGKIGQIDSSSVSLNFYPYFYNWQVSKISSPCISERLPIPILRSSTVDIHTTDFFKIYPNPASTNITISSDHDLSDYTAFVVDVNGKTVLTQKLKSTGENIIDTECLVNGWYVVYVHNGRSAYFNGVLVVD